MIVLSKTDAVSQAYVNQAAAFYKTLPALDAGQDLHRLTMHWQVGTYGQTSCEYNVETVLVDGAWQMRIEQDPRHNAIDLTAESPSGSYAAHTFEHNSHNLGCSIAAMWGATPSNFGQFAVQQHELETFLAMCAAAAVRYNIDPLDSDYVRTHAEWAIADGYFPGDDDPDPRWDFARVNPSDEPLTVEEAEATAQLFRFRMNLYKVAIEKAIA